MNFFYYFFFLYSINISVFGQIETDGTKRDVVFQNATRRWFSAWKLVSNEIYGIKKVKPVEFVFFDDLYVYSTSAISTKNGSSVKGNNLMNLELKWKKKLHNDTLTLPDKSVVPINLMSFAAKIPTASKSFFVMPLPSFWQQAGISSKELGFEHLITGIFIHEFSHSQQMQNFGKKITEFETQNNYGIEFSDDIVQNIFAKDTAYLNHYKKEIEFFYSSVINNALEVRTAKKGLSLMKKRQNKYFNEKYKNLSEIELFFLTMEGLGQYSMFLWLTHPKGGNIKRELAIEGVRRGGKWWSQDEGFALFLILDKLTKPKSWARDMFGDKTESVIAIIDKLIL